VFGVFLSHVRGEFRPVGSASGSTSSTSSAEIPKRQRRVLPQILPCLLPFVLPTFFLEFGAASDGIGFRFFGGFFVFGLGENRLQSAAT